MSQSSLYRRSARTSLLLIDEDPIFRLGLNTVLAQFPDLQVRAEAQTGAAALEMLAATNSTEKGASSSGRPAATSVDLVILDLALGGGDRTQLSGIPLCQQLQILYPNLPILLLSSLPPPPQLRAPGQASVKGYCPKGTDASRIVSAIRVVAAGQTYWSEVSDRSGGLQPQELFDEDPGQRIENKILANLRQNLHLSGLRQIDGELAKLDSVLETPVISAIDWLVLTGRRRELRAARWIVNQLVPAKNRAALKEGLSEEIISETAPAVTLINKVTSEKEPMASLVPTSSAPVTGYSSVQSALFEATRVKIQSATLNLTEVALEIDIFRAAKKLELLNIILCQLDQVLDRLQFSRIQLPQLAPKRSAIVGDLWQLTITEFFGKYYELQVGDRPLELVPQLLEDAEIVKSAILDKIPLVEDLLAHLLFETPLVIENLSYPPGSPESMQRAEALLENLVIQVANGVVQPLLNRFADVEVIKQGFYDRQLLSTREIERFRNELSWKYRREKYWEEPKAIFESRFWLFVLGADGIKKSWIYSSRNQELAELTGVPLAVTFILETRDAIAPRLRALLVSIGRGGRYILLQLGLGIGLIGRGILQGVGNSFQDSRFGKKRQR